MEKRPRAGSSDHDRRLPRSTGRSPQDRTCRPRRSPRGRPRHSGSFVYFTSASPTDSRYLTTSAAPGPPARACESSVNPCGPLVFWIPGDARTNALTVSRWPSIAAEKIDGRAPAASSNLGDLRGSRRVRLRPRPIPSRRSPNPTTRSRARAGRPAIRGRARRCRATPRPSRGRRQDREPGTWPPGTTVPAESIGRKARPTPGAGAV